jgi:hypothetical protein
VSRRPFNLDELLGEKDVRHYLKFIEGANRSFVVNPGSLEEAEDEGRVPPEWEASGGGVWTKPGIPAGREIVRVGFGPDSCSPSGELRVQPEVVWDVCGYYRRLGAHWSATRRQLVSCYLGRAGARQDTGDTRALTYALAQLLDPEIRAAYDRAPLGSLFLLDQPTQEMLKAAAALAAARRAYETGEVVTAEDVLEEQGLRLQPKSAREEAMAAAEEPDPESAESRYVLGSSPALRWQRQWSWYEEPGTLQSAGVLEEWQALLIGAFREENLIVSFAVGFSSDGSVKVILAECPRPLLCLLDNGPPTAGKARDAIAMVRGRPLGE